MISSAWFRFRRSANGEGGNASNDGTNNDRSRASSATMIVSRTVRPPKMRRVLEAPTHAVTRPSVRAPCGRRGRPNTSIVPDDFDETGDRVHQRGLAGAVGADEADDLAGADVDADAADREQAAETDLHVVGAERQHGRLRLRAAISRGERRHVGASRGPSAVPSRSAGPATRGVGPGRPARPR